MDTTDALELAELRVQLDREARRRQAEVKATRWVVAVLAAALKELRRPELPDPVDPREIDEFRAWQRRAHQAEIEDIRADGGDVAAFVAKHQGAWLLEDVRLGLEPWHPDRERQGPRHADAAPIIADLRARGLGLKAVATALNAMEIPTACGGRWWATSVKNLIAKEMARRG
jgi:hypothetical protein